MTTVDTGADEQSFKARLEHAIGADYKLGDLIGEGGFARVYAATDVRLGRSVAIKVIRPELAGARAFMDRFRREGTALAKFRHPGIVPIYDIREHDGVIYYIMPLVAGQTLRTTLDRRGQMSPKETQRILMELCDSLSATHKAGIIHRDIKPDNVFLEGMQGKALLMDFGIAKSQQDEFTGTASGVMMGTPTYMSPEQLSGDGTVDERSDIYSLGVLGYHMLAGKPPFTGKTPFEIASGHMSQQPIAIRQFSKSIPSTLTDPIERCLEKKPEDRFQNVTELWETLRDVSFFGEEPKKRGPPAYLMMLFLGVAVVCALFAGLGVDRVYALDDTDLWYFAAGFLLLSVLVSPVVRAATNPLAESFGERMASLYKRIRGA